MLISCPAGEDAAAAAEYVARRLDAVSEETEKGWVGQLQDDDIGNEFSLIFSRTVRGVKEVHTIDHALIGSADARALDGFAPTLQAIYANPAKLVRQDLATDVYGPRDLLSAVFAAGEKGHFHPTL